MSQLKQQVSPTGPNCSRIVLGLWRQKSWSQSPQQHLAFLQQAVELGVTTIDHADIYGSEIPYGQALQLAPSLRDQMQIVTKCGIILSPQSHHYDTSREHIIASLENSLRYLGTDHVDMLLIHRPDPLMQADEVAAAFEQLQAAGKARYFGVSNFTPLQFELLASRFALVTNQVELSPLHLDVLHDGTLDQCQQRGISPMIWSALAGGRIFNEQSERAQRLRTTLTRLAQGYGVALTTLVYAWILQHPSHPLVLTGSGRIAAIEEAVAAVGLVLERADWFAIWSASTGTEVP